MKLRLETRHRLLVIATGDDAHEIEDQADEIDAVVGSGGSGDLTAAPADSEPTDTRSRRGRGGVGFTDGRSPSA